MKNKKYSLIGVDGNAHSVMGYVSNAMKRSGYTQAEINDYLESVKTGDYNHLLYESATKIDEVNVKNGYDENTQYEKPDASEFESCKVKVKKAKKINEAEDLDNLADSFMNYEDMVKDEVENEEENDNIPMEVKKTLKYALSDALITIWDEYNIEFTKKQAIKWMKNAIDKFDWNGFSLTPLMNDNEIIDNNEDEKLYEKLNKEEWTDADDLHIQLDYEPMQVSRKQSCSKLTYSFYMTAEDLKKCNLEINDFVELNKKFLLNMYVINNKDFQIIFTTNERYKLDKLLFAVKDAGLCTYPQLKKYIENY